MACVLEEPVTEPKVEKAPYKKRPKPCIICGEPSAGVTSYYYEDGTNGIGVPFCQPHLDKREKYATPVFENQAALTRFRTEHPILYNRYVAGKKILFMHSQPTDGLSAE